MTEGCTPQKISPLNTMTNNFALTFLSQRITEQGQNVENLHFE